MMRRPYGGSVFPAHANTGDPNGPGRGLSANQIVCALISMMARSTRSKQRPDTLMQDRYLPGSTKASCNARPVHTLGQSRRFAMSALPSAIHDTKHSHIRLGRVYSSPLRSNCKSSAHLDGSG
jgi:hypothetical protein